MTKLFWLIGQQITWCHSLVNYKITCWLSKKALCQNLTQSKTKDNILWTSSTPTLNDIRFQFERSPLSFSPFSKVIQLWTKSAQFLIFSILFNRRWTPQLFLQVQVDLIISIQGRLLFKGSASWKMWLRGNKNRARSLS